MDVLKTLQRKFKIFGTSAGGNYPGGETWARNQIDVRLKTTGEFGKDEVALYCAVLPQYAQEKFSEYTEQRCPKKCDGGYARGDQCYGKLVDSRDGQSYRTIKIGEQTWMAQNLNYGKAIHHQETLAPGNKYCYADKEYACEWFGGLYTWDAAKESCPKGWHLPTWEEWKTLFTTVGGIESAGRKLKSVAGWESNGGKNGNGEDDYGFAVLPSGEWDIGSDRTAWFSDVWKETTFWGERYVDSDGHNNHARYVVFAYYDQERAYLFPGGSLETGRSIRCLED